MPRTLKIISVEQLVPGKWYRARWGDSVLQFKYTKFTIEHNAIIVHYVANGLEGWSTWLSLRNVEAV